MNPVLERAREVIAKFNPYHDRLGLFARGMGYRAAIGDGTKGATGGGTGKVRAPEKTMEQKQKEIDRLPRIQQEAYRDAPAHLDHEGAMAHAKTVRADVPPRPLKPGFHRASESELRNGVVDDSGVRFRIPPAWADVHVSSHNAGQKGLLISGVDVQGRTQSLYTTAHTKRQAIAKFQRVVDFGQHLDKLDAHIAKGLKKNDPNATVLQLVRVQGLRPGSSKDTGARKKAYGATTLEARHVTINKDSVRIQYVGKEGKDLDFTIKDAGLVKAMTALKAGKRGTDRLFPDVTEATLRDFMHQAVPTKFKLKDLRTVRANVEAMKVVSKMKAPKTKTEFKKLRNQVGDQVSSVLGNTRTMALNSYINPAVFGKWEAGVA